MLAHGAFLRWPSSQTAGVWYTSTFRKNAPFPFSTEVGTLPLKDGHPVADVTLVKDTEWKTVSEKLD
jgi:hypothetical protein